MTKSNIKLTVLDNNLKQIIEIYTDEYQNQMELLRDKMYFDYFGECG